MRNGWEALPRKANQLFQHGIVMNCPRISQKLLKRNCPCRSVLVRGCYLLPRTFTDRHGLIGRLCESVLVRGHYFLPRTYTDQRGLIRRPCESVLVRGHCFLPRTYTDQHGLKVVCASPCLSVAIVFATDVHRLTRTDGQQYLVYYALMKGACGDSPMSYPRKARIGAGPAADARACSWQLFRKLCP